MRELLRECNAAKGAGKLLRESLSELSRQLNLARRYCAQTDRSLCESLQSTGLDLAFTVDEVRDNLGVFYGADVRLELELKWVGKIRRNDVYCMISLVL